MSRQIDALTGVRGLAAAWVVLLHAQLLTPDLLPRVPVLGRIVDGGNLGVDLFFVLSGFVIAYTYLDRLRAPRAEGAVRRYLWLRIARVYPAHLAMLLFVAVLTLGSSLAGAPPEDDRRFSALSFVMNLLMLQSVPPALAWNDPAWSISTELAAYLVFPLLVPLLVSLSPRRALIALIALVVIGVVATSAILMTGDQWPYWAGYALMWTRIAVCFPIGCLLLLLWRDRDADRWDRLSGPAALIAVTGILAACFVIPPGALTLPVLAYPFIPLLLFALASSQRINEGWLASRAMLWAGRISFSVYLVHFPLLLIANQLAESLGVVGGAPLGLAALGASLLGILLAGAGLYHFVEEPCRRMIRRWTEQRASR